MSNFSFLRSLKPYIAVLALALNPIVNLYAANIDQLSLNYVLLPLVLILTAALVLSIALTWLFKDVKAGVFLTCVVLVLVFSYGHLYNWLQDTFTDSNFYPYIAHKYLVSLWVLVLVAAIVLTVRRSKVARNSLPFLLTFSLVLIAFSTFDIIRYVARRPAGNTSQANQTIAQQSDDIESLPNIYYIILDGYARSDILLQNFYFCNSEFTGALEERGFYVAAESASNYSSTLFSLASSLNMTYLDEVAEENGLESTDQGPYAHLIKRSEVTIMLKALGYDYYVTPSVYGPTTGSSLADNRRFRLGTSDFNVILANTTILRALEIDFNPPNALESIVRELADTSKLSNPTFVFAHILAPHPPYYFAERRDPSWDGTVWTDRRAYVEEVEAVNQLMIDVIDEIVEQSETPPIIIVQSDHGPAAVFREEGLDWNRSTDELFAVMSGQAIYERMSILNAYYVPQEIYSQLYPSISPVNSFRLALNYLSEQEMNLLPDKSYLVGFNSPNVFVELDVPSASSSSTATDISIHPVSSQLGDEITLVGYTAFQDGKAVTLDSTSPGRLELTLYWHTLAQPEADYILFVHVQQDNDTLVFGQDGPPLNGTYPTTQWRAGRIIRTHHELVLPEESESLLFYTGMYTWPDIQRLSVVQDGQHVEDDRVRLWSTEPVSFNQFFGTSDC